MKASSETPCCQAEKSSLAPGAVARHPHVMPTGRDGLGRQRVPDLQLAQQPTAAALRA